MQPVIQVVGGIRQLIGGVGDLGFEMSAQFRIIVFRVRDIILGLMFDDAFSGLPGQVKAGEFLKTVFELGDDPQGLFVVVETALVFHQKPIRSKDLWIQSRGQARFCAARPSSPGRGH